MSDNKAILLLGSNIDPFRNIQKALMLLERSLRIHKRSNLWITEAVGSDGPEFLNMAIEVETKLNADQIKSEVIFVIEKELLRVRTADKYAPRTIDIDLIVFNENVMDPNLWQRLFVALPVSEILPDLTNNSTGEVISEAVLRLKNSAKAELFSELK